MRFFQNTPINILLCILGIMDYNLDSYTNSDPCDQLRLYKKRKYFDYDLYLWSKFIDFMPTGLNVFHLILITHKDYCQWSDTGTYSL